MTYGPVQDRQDVRISAGTAFKIGFVGFFGFFFASLIVSIVLVVISLIIGVSVAGDLLDS